VLVEDVFDLDLRSGSRDQSAALNDKNKRRSGCDRKGETSRSTIPSYPHEADGGGGGHRGSGTRSGGRRCSPWWSCRRERAASEQDLIEHCRARIAHFKAPKTIEIREVLARTATGKLQKYSFVSPIGRAGTAPSTDGTG